MDSLELRWHHLPDEVWHHIMSFVGLEDVAQNVPFVCYEWYQLFWLSSPREILDFSELKKRKVTKKDIESTLRRFPRAKHMSFWRFGSKWVGDPILKILAGDYESLQVDNQNQNLLGTGQWKPSQLETLSLEGCGKITDDGIKVLTRNCIKLERLNLRGCFLVENFNCLDVKFLERVKYLDLSGSKSLTTESLHRILTHSKCLEELYITGCSKLTGILCTPNSNFLRKIHASYCVNITDELALKPISEYALNLESISLQGCPLLTNNGVVEMIANCKNLKIISLIDACNKQLQNDCVQKISEVLGGELIELNLKNSPLITDEGFVSLTECKKLKVLNLDRCPGLSDSALESVLASIGSTLITLNLSACQQLSDVSLKSVAEYCPYLENLNFAGWENISEEMIMQVARACTKLKMLNVSLCPIITAPLLENIIQCSVNLNKINASGVSINEEELIRLKKVFSSGRIVSNHPNLT